MYKVIMVMLLIVVFATGVSVAMADIASAPQTTQQLNAEVQEPISFPFPKAPVLTPEQESMLDKIVFSDKEVGDIIGKRDYVIIATGSWITQDNRDLIGGFIEILFNEPFKLDREWLDVHYEGDAKRGTADYIERTYRQELEVKKLNIRVDFAKQKVVDINALPFGQLPEDPPIAGGGEKGGVTSVSAISIPGGDMIVNFDFHSQSVSAGNADWPVTIIYGGDANVSNVKAMYWGGSGGTKYSNYNDDGGWEWDSDAGTKSTGITACHMRVYADNGNHSYNGTLGDYVWGTTHYDRYEGWPWPYDDEYGWSEDARAEILNRAQSQGHYTVQNYCWLANYLGNYWYGDHYYQCDGWASFVLM